MRKLLKCDIYQLSRGGFTLLELLVVISIIGIFTAVTIGAMSDSRENAQAARAVADAREVVNTVVLYLTDTKRLPPTCDASCTAANDPFLVAPSGVGNWAGPYQSVWNKEHPWGGTISIWNYTGGFYITFDDDRSGSGGADDGGQIPVSALEQMDQILDDGNLATGDFIGNDTDGSGFCAVGEGCWRIRF